MNKVNEKMVKRVYTKFLPSLIIDGDGIDTTDKFKMFQLQIIFVNLLKYLNKNVLNDIEIIIKDPALIDIDGFKKVLNNFQDIDDNILFNFIKDPNLRDKFRIDLENNINGKRGGLTRKKRRIQKKRKNLYGGDNDLCTICNSTWEETPNMSTCEHLNLHTQWNHKYHSSCLVPWYKANIDNRCPFAGCKETDPDPVWTHINKNDGYLCPGMDGWEREPGDTSIIPYGIRRILENLTSDDFDRQTYNFKIILIFIIIIIIKRLYRIFMFRQRRGPSGNGGDFDLDDVF